MNKTEKKNQPTFAGRFLYENNTKGDLILPQHPINKSSHTLKPRQRFEGDDYYMHMVPKELRYIEDLEKMSEKLITEQPPMITTEGKVEFVKQDFHNKKKLNENLPEETEAEADVLLNETPMDGIELI